MGLFEVLRGGKRQPNAALDAFVAEVRAQPNAILADAASFASGRALLASPPAQLAATLVDIWAFLAGTEFGSGNYQVFWPLRSLLTALQRKRPPLTVEQLVTVLGHATRMQTKRRAYASAVGIVGAAEAVLANERPPELVRALELLSEALGGDYSTADDRRLIARIGRVLGGEPETPLASLGPFGRRVAADVEGGPASGAWKALLEHGRTATAAKPTARWLKQATQLLDAIGREAAASRLAGWLDLGPCPGEPAGTRTTEGDADLIKGLLFSAAALGDAALAPAIANIAAASLRKIPNIGPVSARVGNAGINALAELPGPAAITQLGRLRLLVKYSTARRLVENALNAAAERAGVTAAEIEEMSVPTYGLGADGVARTACGAEGALEIAIGDDEATLTFRADSGKVPKSIPASVKRDHAAAVSQARRTMKEIAQVLPAQRLRLETLMITGRELAVDQWRTRYLQHPLVGDMSRRLIWSFTAGGTTRTAMSVDGRLLDAHGADVDVPGDARVQLHHPLRGTPDETLAWRRFLESRELTQPFKQAHREIYIVTDAELATDTYSNRFAGHILRQHQLAALCRDRGWQYRLQGAFDSANNPCLTIPGTNLSAELWTQSPETADAPLSQSAIFLHVATDQVRFSDAGDSVPVAQVPPLVFSEVMRDVDLFVSVCSIGTDPTWTDQGERPGYQAYWREFAFGDLSASAKTRRAVLESVLPKLKIRDRCSFDERHLVVRGELATYRIHLGSGNILIEPGSRYLCIVPDARSRGERVTLPFKGDAIMAVILSKAFLLAADRDIKDPTIVSQIRLPR